MHSPPLRSSAPSGVGGGQWEVAANTKVGVAAVSGVTLWIKPKVDIRRILFLLGYAKNPGWRDDTVALAQVTDLVPALAHAFADQAERALDRGLVQGYVEVDDSLTVLRGRLRDQDQLRRRFGIAVPLLVRFDDYTTDIAENQLLRAAAELLLRLPEWRHAPEPDSAESAKTLPTSRLMCEGRRYPRGLRHG